MRRTFFERFTRAVAMLDEDDRCTGVTGGANERNGMVDESVRVGDRLQRWPSKAPRCMSMTRRAVEFKSSPGFSKLLHFMGSRYLVSTMNEQENFLCGLAKRGENTNGKYRAPTRDAGFARLVQSRRK